MIETTATLHGVSKRYGETVAVDELDLELRRGEILALLGPNGAGKTTSIRMLLGITRPDCGTVEILGSPPLRARRQGRLGVVLQSANVPETLRVREQIEQFRSYYPDPRPVDQILDFTGTREISGSLFGTLSGGQKQRVLFALAIAGNPDIVLLDEPTVGLDARIRRDIWSRVEDLRDEGTSILLTTHDLREAERLSDRVVVIRDGRKIAEGSPEVISERACDRSIVCRTGLSAEELEALPSISSVFWSDGHAEIRTSNAELTLRALLDRDAALADLEVRRVTLEQAFLELTESKEAA